MQAALDAARDAATRGEVPVGAAVFETRTGRILAVAANEREQRSDPTAHAEIVALRSAAEQRGNWRLDGCSLAVTLEPCTMCAGAMVLARLDRVLYGAADPKAGACGSLYNVCEDPRLNHSVAVTWGVREDDCAALLRTFFATKRGGTP